LILALISTLSATLTIRAFTSLSSASAAAPGTQFVDRQLSVTVFIQL
jgi:hypothetical protein